MGDDEEQCYQLAIVGGQREYVCPFHIMSCGGMGWFSVDHDGQELGWSDDDNWCNAENFRWFHPTVNITKIGSRVECIPITVMVILSGDFKNQLSNAMLLSCVELRYSWIPSFRNMIFKVGSTHPREAAYLLFLIPLAFIIHLFSRIHGNGGFMLLIGNLILC